MTSINRGEFEGEFLTVAEVAEVLKLNQQTVRNWIDQGSLPAVRVGRRVRIKRADFERVLAQGYNAAQGAAGRDIGPSADDFWGGELVGRAEPDPSREGATYRSPEDDSHATSPADASIHKTSPADGSIHAD